MTGIALQLAASATTGLQMWLYGNKSTWGPAIGLASTVCWFAVMFWHDLWGLLPLNTVMLVINARNLVKWRREARRHTPQMEAGGG